MSTGKNKTAISRVFSLFSEWDNGNKITRAAILRDFIEKYNNFTGAELELEFAQAASLFLARITAWLRLSYIDATCLQYQLTAINIFLNASNGHRFLIEFLEVGGILTTLEVLGLNNASEADKQAALQLIQSVAKCGRKHKELICESYGIRSIAECLARSSSDETQELCRQVLEELAHGNDRYEMQVYKGLIALLPSSSPKAQQLALQCLRIVQPIVKKVHPNIVEPLLDLLKSFHLEVQFEVIEFIKDLMAYDEIQITIIKGLTKLLIPDTFGDPNRVDMFKDDGLVKFGGSLPVFIQQATSAKAIGILCRDSLEIAEKFILHGAVHRLMVAMGNADHTDSQRQASIVVEHLARSFPLVNEVISQAMGDTLYQLFMTEPESLYLNMNSVQTDILVSNKVDIANLLKNQEENK